MPHLNELQEQFGERGLTVVGVTGEGPRMTEPWVAERGARLAYGYDKKGALGCWFGVRGIPDAVLIDANGTILWRGDPMMLDAKTVESALDGALGRSLWKWPRSASKVKKALEAGFLLATRLGEPAAKQLKGLPEGDQVAGALADIK